MSQHDKSAKLFDTVDDLADQQLQELQSRVESAREHIEGAARLLAAQLRGEDPPIIPSPALPPASTAPAPVPSASLTPRPILPDAPDFGDIAATIATDEEGQKR